MFPKRAILMIFMVIFPLQLFRLGSDVFSGWVATLGVCAAVAMYYFAFHRPIPLAMVGAMMCYDYVIFANAQTVTPPYTAEMVIGWVTTIIVLIMSCMSRSDLTGWFDISTRENRWYYGAVLVVTLVGALIRLYRLTADPVLNGDETSIALFGMTYFDGSFSNPFVSGWLEVPSLLSYIPGLAIRLLGQTIWALRLPNVLFGVMSIPLTIWMARPLLARPYAIIAGVVVATLGLDINFSRINFIIIFDMMCALGIIGLMLRCNWGFTLQSVILIGVICGIGQFGYANARNLALLLIIWTILQIFRMPSRTKSLLYHLVVCGAVTIAVAGPLLLHYYQYPDNFRAPLQRASLILPDSPDGSSVLTRQMAEQHKTATTIILENMRTSFNAIVFGPVDGWYSSNSAILPPWYAIMFALGIGVVLWNWRLPTHTILLINILFVCLTASLSYPVAAGHRMVSMLGSVATMIGLGAQGLDAIRSRVLPSIRVAYVSYAVIASMVIIGAYQSVNHYFNVFVKIENGAGDPAMQACSQLAQYAQKLPAGTKIDVYETDYLNRAVTGVIPFFTNHVDYRAVANGGVPRTDAQVVVIPMDRLDVAQIPEGFRKVQVATNFGQPMMIFAIAPTIAASPTP